MSRRFDAIIVGAGQAGPSLAARLDAAGQTVAIVERHLFGGTCVNTGCMPTKTLVASAYAAHLARRAGDYGLDVGPVAVDMKRVAARAHQVTLNSRHGIESWLEGLSRTIVIRGHARFVSADTLVVNGEEISAERIFLNVGGRAAIPDMPGLDGIDYLTNTSILALETVPRHLVVIGGSYIGLEFAQMYRRFGAEVTIVEKGPRLIAREDEDVSEGVRGILEAEGIAVHVGIGAVAFHREGAEIAVDIDGTQVGASHVLIAVGRRPNTDDLGLDRAGVHLDKRGYIVVDDKLATNVPGIFALGDCNGRGAFTHTAYNDFEIVAANLLDGADRRLSQRILGYALYIDPPLGRVGLTETQACEAGRPILVGTRPMTRVGRAVEKGETQGFMKIVVDAETKRILGASILGTGGDEAIHGILDIMNADVPYTVLQWAVPIHPTVSELIPTVLGDLKPVP